MNWFGNREMPRDAFRGWAFCLDSGETPVRVALVVFRIVSDDFGVR